MMKSHENRTQNVIESYTVTDIIIKAVRLILILDMDPIRYGNRTDYTKNITLDSRHGLSTLDKMTDSKKCGN